jgi:hypothetical protein
MQRATLTILAPLQFLAIVGGISPSGSAGGRNSVLQGIFRRLDF